jgi:polyphosphate kinase
LTEWYIGSADLMDRNLDRRVEAMVPVEDGDARARIAEIIEVLLQDDRRSWQLGPDATWRRTEDITGVPGTFDCHEELKARALTAVVNATAPHRPRAGVGSLDPRA